MSLAVQGWIRRTGVFALVMVMATAAQIATASAQDTDTRRPASIQSGTCDSPGGVVFELNDLLVLRADDGGTPGSTGDDSTDDDGSSGDDSVDDGGTPGSSDDDAGDDGSDDNGGDDGWQQDGQGQFVGSEGASIVERSEDTELPTTLDDLLGAPHVVTVFESDSSETIIACGEIGGFVFSDDDDDDLVIGLRE